MGSHLGYLNQCQKELHLVARTGALSPAEISVFLQVLATPLGLALIGGLTDAVGGRVFDWVKDSIASRQTDKKVRNELVRSLFGYCRNADFFVGKIKGLPPENDLKAAIEILRLCVGIFGKEPEYKKEEKSEAVKFERNLICVGDVNNNPVTKYIFGQVAELPYKFSLQDNILVLSQEKEGIVLAPESYPGDILVKDYAMITQIANLVPNYRLLGRKMLIVSGTTPLGTWGAALAIKERDEILNQIWAETKGRDFQAILSIDLENKEPINMSLLDIRKL